MTNELNNRDGVCRERQLPRQFWKNSLPALRRFSFPRLLWHRRRRGVCPCVRVADTGRWGRGGKRNNRAQQGAAALDALLSELGPAGLSETLCSSAVLENLVACMIGAPPSPLEQTLLKGIFSVTLAATPQV
jgi:hypothetical protein